MRETRADSVEADMADKEELYDEAIDAYADDKFDEAIELYKQALAIDPKYVDAIHGMTMCYQAKGDLDAGDRVDEKIYRTGAGRHPRAHQPQHVLSEEGNGAGSGGGGRRSAAARLEAATQGRQKVGRR